MATGEGSQPVVEAEPSLSSVALENSQLCKLFVGGLAEHIDEFALRQYFGAFGHLKDCIILKNAQTHRNRGFGFITYSSVNEADTAMAASPHSVNGNQVHLRWAVTQEDAAKPGAFARVNKIFVGGLKGDITEVDLVRYFSQFGLVENAEILINKQSGKKRGFGFVQFFNHNTADKAAVVKVHYIRGHQVEVRKALPKKQIQPPSLDLPMLESCFTWRPSSPSFTLGLQTARNLSPAPLFIPTPMLPSAEDPKPEWPSAKAAEWPSSKAAEWPSSKAAEWPSSKPDGWPSSKSDGWLNPKPDGWLSLKSTGWLGPKFSKDLDTKPAGSLAPEPENVYSYESVGGPKSKSAGSFGLNPVAVFDPKFDTSLVSSLTTKPVGIPRPKSGWCLDSKPSWDTDPQFVEDPYPKPVRSPDPKAVGGLKPKHGGGFWVTKAKSDTTTVIGTKPKFFTHPGFKPVYPSNLYSSHSLDSEANSALGFNYDPKSEYQPSSGLDPKRGTSFNRAFYLQFGAVKLSKPDSSDEDMGPILGSSSPGPSPGLGLASDPCYDIRRGTGNLIGRGRPYCRFRIFSGGRDDQIGGSDDQTGGSDDQTGVSDNQTSARGPRTSYSLNRPIFRLGKRPWAGRENQGGSSRDTF